MRCIKVSKYFVFLKFCFLYWLRLHHFREIFDLIRMDRSHLLDWMFVMKQQLWNLDIELKKNLDIPQRNFYRLKLILKSRPHQMDWSRPPYNEEIIRNNLNKFVWGHTWLKVWLLAAAFDDEPERPPPNPPPWLKDCDEAPAFAAKNWIKLQYI